MPFPRIIPAAAVFVIAAMLVCCRNATPMGVISSDIVSTVPSAIHVPLSIQRLAILYSEPSDRRFMNAYLRLEAGTFQLKELRPALKLLERSDLRRILDEQRFELSQGVSDDTAVHLGRLLGVDSVVLYRVEGPSARDRALAGVVGGLPPVVVVTKILNMEDGEVVFLNAVTLHVGTLTDESFSSSSMESAIQTALDRAVRQAIADLRHAFSIDTA